MITHVQGIGCFMPRRMKRNRIGKLPFHHRQVDVEGLSIHVIEGGLGKESSFLFLHGWPENWESFESLMLLLAEEAHVVAIDLPGIGGSQNIFSYNAEV